MSSGNIAGYRSKCRIYADILRAICDSEDARVTYLIHKANLSYDRLIVYLSEMEKSGLIQKKELDDKAGYLATNKGLKYLTEFRKIEDFGEVFGVKI